MSATETEIINKQNNVLENAKEKLLNEYTKQDRNIYYKTQQADWLKYIYDLTWYIYYFVAVIMIIVFILVGKKDNERELLVWVVLVLTYPFWIYWSEKLVWEWFVYAYSFFMGITYEQAYKTFSGHFYADE